MTIRRSPQGAGSHLHWWHLGALLALVSAVEAGRRLIGGAGPGLALRALPQDLYAWCPVLAGVAISIRRADRRSFRAALGVGVAIALLMVALDLTGGSMSIPQAEVAARTREGLSSRTTRATTVSWVVTGAEWLRGDLAGVHQRLRPEADYPIDHPRGRAADALLDGSLVLLVFAVLGLVLAAGRWIRGHVTFQRREDERAAHLVVAWLLAPMIMVLAAGAADRARNSALFGGSPLRSILLAPLGMLAVGVVAWIWAARQAARDEVDAPFEEDVDPGPDGEAPLP